MATARILYLEDEPDDVVLVQRTLERERIDARLNVVATRDAFLSALERADFDLILSDSGLPDFDSVVALNLARSSCPRVPFIFLRGSFESDHSVSRLKALGAANCVTKTQLDHLAAAIRNTMDQISCV